MRLGTFGLRTHRREHRHTCPSHDPGHFVLIPGSDARKEWDMLAVPISVLWQPLRSLSWDGPPFEWQERKNLITGGLKIEGGVVERAADCAGTCGDATRLGALEPQTHRRECRYSCPSNGQGHPIPIPGLDAYMVIDSLAVSSSLVWQPLGSWSWDGPPCG
jgi:hypothetical protein